MSDYRDALVALHEEVRTQVCAECDGEMVVVFEGAYTVVCGRSTGVGRHRGRKPRPNAIRDRERALVVDQEVAKGNPIGKAEFERIAKEMSG